MRKISKKTKKFFNQNITSKNTKFVPIVKDVKKIIDEFNEFFDGIYYLVNNKIYSKKPSNEYLLKIIKEVLKDLPEDKLLVFFNKHSIEKTFEKWESDICPLKKDRPCADKMGYPQCLLYKCQKTGRIFYNGCGLNTLAFLGFMSPSNVISELEKKSKSDEDSGSFTMMPEIIKYVKKKISPKRRVKYTNLLLNTHGVRPDNEKAHTLALVSLVILYLTLEKAKEDNKDLGEGPTLIVYQKFPRDKVSHTVVYTYEKYGLYMYDPQLLKKADVMSHKGIRHFNYKFYDGLVVMTNKKNKKSKKKRK